MQDVACCDGLSRLAYAPVLLRSVADYDREYVWVLETR